MKNILVTGGAGFIGSNFVRFLLEKEPGAHVYNLDLLTYAGSLENLKNLPSPDRHTFIHGDIGDADLLDRIFDEHAIDTVVHFAAESHVDRSILGPEAFIQTNIIGTFKLLQTARKHWLTGASNPAGYRFHHVSTDEVFGSLAPQDPAFEESTPYSPNSPYSASKASSDHLVRAYFHTYGLPVSLTNCSNNYGPFQFPEKFVPLMIFNAMMGKPLPVYGDGQQIRDWLYVEDHCEAIWRVLKFGKVGETYNIGGNNQPTNLEVLDSICAILDERLPQSPFRPHASLKTFVKDRPGHDRRYAINITKVNTELGWAPRHNLKAGLEATIDWYLNNTAWLQAISKNDEFQNWLDHNYEKRGGSQ